MDDSLFGASQFLPPRNGSAVVPTSRAAHPATAPRSGG